MEIITDVQSGYRLIITAELGKLYPLRPNDIPTIATESAQVVETTPSPSPTPTIITQASPSPTPRPVTTPNPSTPPKPYIEILTTSTGWLRVRSEPNGLVDNEVAKVDSGTTYPYLEYDDSGWYKIEYESGKQGWIASQYAKLVE